MVVDKSKLNSDDVLYENEYQRIKMINANYPFTHMKCNGVVILPFDSKDNIYMLHLERPQIGLYYELPRGAVEPNEDYKEGALRELAEETGLKPLEVFDFGTILPDTGLLKHNIKLMGILVEEKMEDFFTKYDNADKRTFEVHKFRMEDLYDLVINEEIVCGYTMSGISKFMSHRCKDIGLVDDGYHTNVNYLMNKALELIPFSQKEYLKGKNNMEKVLNYLISVLEA